MAEKVKVPTLNLNKNVTAPATVSQLNTVPTTDAESSITCIPGSSFYTQRGATNEYIIPGLQNSDKKAKEDVM